MNRLYTNNHRHSSTSIYNISFVDFDTLDETAWRSREINNNYDAASHVNDFREDVDIGPTYEPSKLNERHQAILRLLPDSSVQALKEYFSSNQQTQKQIALKLKSSQPLVSHRIGLAIEMARHYSKLPNLFFQGSKAIRRELMAYRRANGLPLKKMHIDLYLAFLEERSLSRTALRLKVSQGLVSQILSDLDKRLTGDLLSILRIFKKYTGNSFLLK